MLQCVMVTLVIRPAMQGLHTGINACRSSSRAVWIVWGSLEAGYSSTPGYALVSDFPVHVFATQLQSHGSAGKVSIRSVTAGPSVMKVGSEHVRSVSGDLDCPVCCQCFYQGPE